MSPISPYAHVGNTWSLWAPAGDDGGLNLVSGVRKVASDIISVLLIRQGEDPLHPEFGLAPDLFDSLSSYDPQYWVYHAREAILRWVAGLSALQIEIQQFPDPENRLAAHIAFTPSLYTDPNILTFGWYAYTGAIWSRELTTFLAGVQLNGEKFVGLTSDNL